MIRIMGRGNGRPQALASVAYSYLCPSPFSGPWIHPTSPPTSLSLHSNPLSLLLSFFLQYFPFIFYFLKVLLFLKFFSGTWVETPPAHKKSSLSFWPFRALFFPRDLVAFCRSYLNCYYIPLKEGGYCAVPKRVPILGTIGTRSDLAGPCGDLLNFINRFWVPICSRGGPYLIPIS